LPAPQFKRLRQLAPVGWRNLFKGENVMHEQAKVAQFTLYGTSACHLCELAEEMLMAHGLNYTKVDISDAEALLERYGVLIPVLRHPDGRELNWPFSTAQLVEFTAS
jgi:Glutaredoxin-like domain (DUF836)